MKELTQKDPLTGEEFIPKRVNQRFASASNRKKFNNQQANALRKKRATINGPLNKTHLLLIKLMNGRNEAEFSKDYLDGYGVELNLFNHIVKINDYRHHAIFEFVLLFLDNNIIKIIRHGRYQ
mgnify:CR=1 FL=1|jgi:hypothetical protein